MLLIYFLLKVLERRSLVSNSRLTITDSNSPVTLQQIMSDLEKGKSEKGSKSTAAPPAKKDAKPDNSWSKIPLAIAIFLMVILIILFSTCKFLPRFVSQHCQAAPVYYTNNT
ncbi:hypothetical protein PGT21_017449 [Puccinia graminis f. sp. tritici]|uniref:Uncharacterized protein n=2 Tax=Puccinia graminis f. sp. tritici TaxID=56615 RepID=A0A5B0N4D6_PUCGR|nr:hypothetical protein PGT21_017449 [Puccinia graminis f. sp. tritici]